MSYLIGILTIVLVLNCFLLVLLILIQLPKKESGSGLAFGGGAMDMALGAGAGNVLTKLTKISAGLFLLLCLVLAIIGNPGKRDISQRIGAQPQSPATPSATNGAETDATQVQAEVSGKIDDALADSAETLVPTTPQAITPPATPEKPVETPTAPAKGEEKK